MNSLPVYPYVKLRVNCPCGYRKAYRLATAAEHDGADIFIALFVLLVLGLTMFKAAKGPCAAVAQP